MRKMKSKLLLLGLLCCVQFLWAQNRTVNGRIVNAEGSGIPNASVTVKGTSVGTTTNLEGNFSLSVPATAKALVVSYVGFTTQEFELNANSNNVIITLTAEEKSMDEVVITGYTRERRGNYSGSVAKVTASAINQVPMASIDQILQGRAPGLYVASGSGQPGAAATVIIRGVGTISGSSAPLYVMDGIPISAAAFAAISASDIQSVDVLKDAAATALYGSRGSNGVIVITTKRGRASGKVLVGVKSQVGVAQRPSPKFQNMDSRERIQFEEEIGLETGQEIGPGWKLSRSNPDNANLPEATLQQYDMMLDSLRNMNVDWRDIFFRNGSFQEHEINASGGSEKVSFYSAINYFKNTGIALRSGLERYSLRNNVDFRSDRFTAALSTTLNYSQSSFIENENTTGITNPFASVYYALPYEQPYINGVLVHPGNQSSYNVLDLREGSTALERALATTSKNNELRSVLGGNFRYKITNNFSLVSTLGLDFREVVTERFFDPNTYTGGRVAGNQGSFGESSGRLIRLFGNGGVNFNKTFNKNHLVDVTALYEGIKTTTRNFNYTGYGINPLLSNTPAAITPGSATGGFIPLVGGSRTINALQSAMAIGKYVYNNKYTVNASYRIDGSSSVPEKNRWIGYYSAGLSWNVMRETFMDNVAFVSDLQLRASYGITASPFPTNFGYLSTYANSRYDGQTGLGVSQIGNANYDWEYNKMANIGIDFSFFERRISGSVDVYNKLTENLFIDQRLSATSGANELSINAGKVRNRGLELALNGDLISKNDFRWSLGGNAAFNQNRIVDLGQVNEFEQGTSIIRVGLPLGSHYIVKWAGVDASTGNPLYYNRDGSVTTEYNEATQNVADFGSYLPKVQGGFNTALRYKGLYAEAFFSFATGSRRFNNEDFFNETPSFATSNQSTRLLGRWKNPGDITDIQKFSSARNFSSKDIQDASFLRFRNLNFGYSIPAGVLGRITDKVSSFTFYIQGQNLYTWTNWRGFDPEDNNNISTFEYPSQRTTTVGINVTF